MLKTILSPVLSVLHPLASDVYERYQFVRRKKPSLKCPVEHLRYEYESYHPKSDRVTLRISKFGYVLYWSNLPRKDYLEMIENLEHI